MLALKTIKRSWKIATQQIDESPSSSTSSDHARSLTPSNLENLAQTSAGVMKLSQSSSWKSTASSRLTLLTTSRIATVPFNAEDGEAIDSTVERTKTNIWPLALPYGSIKSWTIYGIVFESGDIHWMSNVDFQRLFILASSKLTFMLSRQEQSQSNRRLFAKVWKAGCSIDNKPLPPGVMIPSTQEKFHQKFRRGGSASRSWGPCGSTCTVPHAWSNLTAVLFITKPCPNMFWSQNTLLGRCILFSRILFTDSSCILGAIVQSPHGPLNSRSRHDLPKHCSSPTGWMFSLSHNLRPFLILADAQPSPPPQPDLLRSCFQCLTVASFCGKNQLEISGIVQLLGIQSKCAKYTSLKTLSCSAANAWNQSSCRYLAAGW